MSRSNIHLTIVKDREYWSALERMFFDVVQW
jgi:hypothetical protein